jgi:hypothetical protein
VVNWRARSSAHDKSAMRLMRSLAAIDQPSEQASDMLVAPATATARTLAHIVAVLLAASWISSGGYLIEALIHINLRVRTALTTPVLRSPPNPLLGFSLIDPFTTAILFGAVLSIATWPIRSSPDPSRARSRVGGHTLALAFDCGRGSADAGPRTQPCRPTEPALRACARCR